MINIKSREELVVFMTSEVIDTSEVIEILGCSRQYLHQIIDIKIFPIYRNNKVNLYLKSEILEFKKVFNK